MVSAHAPLGIEILGSHTDYNEGLGLAAATQFGVTVEGDARQDNQIVLHLEGSGQTETFSVGVVQKHHSHPWSNPVKGVLQQLLGYQVPIGGFEAVIRQHLPEGFDLSGGLLAVGAALFLKKLFPFDAEPTLIAKICHDAEVQMGNSYCGMLGIAASLCGVEGSLLLIDFRSMEMTPLPFPPTHRFVVCDSGIKNMLIHSKVKLRRDQCAEALRVARSQAAEVRALRDVNPVEMQRIAGHMNEYVFRTAMHVVTENQRIREAVDALGRGDLAAFGANLNLSQLSSKQSIENSTPQIDDLTELARTYPGAGGSRLMGYGFGGPTIHLVEAEQAESLAASLPQLYESRTGKRGAAFVVELSSGGIYL